MTRSDGTVRAFPWRAGMRAIDKDGRFWRLFHGPDATLFVQSEPPSYCGEWERIRGALGAAPDPNDGATKGAFLEAVREAWGEAFGTGVINVRPYDATQWACYCCNMAMTEPQPTEFAALLAAWEAAP